MDVPNSVSLWISQLKDQDAMAAQRLWDRYSGRLVQVARTRLKEVPKRITDEDDIVASVFESLCRGATAGRFQNVKNRDELWWLLLGITKRKVVDHVRRETAQKRGGQFVQVDQFDNEYDGHNNFELSNLIGDEPTPEFTLILQEQYERLLNALRDDCLRQIAISRIDGYTVNEIAEKLALSCRSVERKLSLIRNIWSKELISQ